MKTSCLTPPLSIAFYCFLYELALSTREFCTFTHEFARFTREFSTFNREFTPFTREFSRFTSEFCVYREFGHYIQLVHLFA
ncbi:hypothetical protein ACQKOM_11730 [Peribacillus frigoritolerans]|uniref:hypothetical protein n=1 Tax=Peribacillus frigoritolerans TaxID=450367 RepID=UPI003D044638